MSSCDYNLKVLWSIFLAFVVYGLIGFGILMVLDFLEWVGVCFEYSWGIEPGPGATIILLIIFLAIAGGILLALKVFGDFLRKKSGPSKTLETLVSFKETMIDKICVPVKFIDTKGK